MKIEDNKIMIGEKEYELKFNLRGFLIFEQITGKPFAITNVSDSLVAAYSFIVGANMEFKDDLTFDDFINAASEDPSILQRFNEMFKQHERFQQQMAPQEKPSKKAKTQKK